MSEDEKDMMDEVIENDDLDITDAEEADDDGKAEKDQPKAKDSVDDLAAKVEALAKEKDGMYRELRAERQTRQELKGKIDMITEMMATARANRESMIEDAAEKAVDGTKTKAGIPVSFDDNGNPFIDPKDLVDLTGGELSKVKKELSDIKNQNFHRTAVDQNQTILSEVFNQDERYPAAYGKVQKAYAYLDKATGDVMRKYNMTIQTTSLDEVMTLLEKEYGGEFSDMFPGLDIDVVVDACTVGPNGLFRPRKVEKALKTAAAIEDEKGSGNQKIKNLKFIASKPSNLSGQRNQKGAAGRTLNDIADMDTRDFENMSDADFRRLEGALKRMGA